MAVLFLFFRPHGIAALRNSCRSSIAGTWRKMVPFKYLYYFKFRCKQPNLVLCALLGTFLIDFTVVQIEQ